MGSCDAGAFFVGVSFFGLLEMTVYTLATQKTKYYIVDNQGDNLKSETSVKLLGFVY
jgi:hypothetical protein